MILSFPNTSSQEQSERNNNNFISSSLPEPKLTKADKEFGSFLNKRSHLLSKHFSIAYIASCVGRSYKTVHRSIHKYIAMGLITHVYRHRKTSLYILTSAFFDHPFIKELTKVASFLSLALLMSGCWVKAHRDDPGVTHYKNVRPRFILKEYIYKTNTSTSIYSYSISTNTNREEGKGSMKPMNTKDPDKKVLLDKLAKIVPLTEHGIIAMGRYACEVLKKVIENAPRAMQVETPFRYLCFIAEKYSKEFNLKVDYSGYHLERISHAIDENDTEFVSEIRLQIMQSEAKTSQPKVRESTGNRTPFKLSEEDERRVENKQNVSLEIANMADVTNPYMKMLQDHLRKTLREQGHVLDCDQNEAIESSIKELKNESEGVCPERTPYRVDASWSQT